MMMLGPCLAYGQVNVERLRPSVQPDVLSQSLMCAFTYLTGNSDSLEILPSYRVDYATPTWSMLGIGNLRYGSRNGANFVNQGFVHLRGSLRLDPTATWEGFVQKEYDDFRRVTDRQLLGSNYRLSIVDDTWFTGSGALGLMAESETNTVEGLMTLVRFNSYLTGTLRGSNVTCVVTTYLQPALRDFSDFRVLADATVTVMMTDLPIGLSTGLKLFYDSQPPAGVGTIDLGLTSGVNVHF